MTFLEKSADLALAVLIGLAIPALVVYGPSLLTR